MVDYRNRILTFSQEFTAPTLDPIWRTAYGWSGGTGRTLSGNLEAEYYCDPNTPGTIGGTPDINPYAYTGNSVIFTAMPSIDMSNTTGTRALSFSSAMLSTWNSFSQRFGRFEMRARFAVKNGTGRGFWPAFWLLPADVTWKSEIDICELFLGPNIAGEGGGNAVHTGLVASTPDGQKHYGVATQWNKLAASYMDGNFHTYWLEWDSLHMTWGFDDFVLNTIRTPSLFVDPMYIIANLAVGQAGAWPNAPEPGASATMEIDHIRAFSDFPDAKPVAWGGTSSPDGVDTTPVGAISATGPIKVGSGTLTITASTLNLPTFTSLPAAKFNVLVDGVTVATGLVAKTDYSQGQWATLTVPNVAIDGAYTIGIQMTNAFWAPGPPPWNCVLYVEKIDYSDPVHGLTGSLAASCLATPPKGVTIANDGSVRLGSNAIATFSMP